MCEMTSLCMKLFSYDSADGMLFRYTFSNSKTEIIILSLFKVVQFCINDLHIIIIRLLLHSFKIFLHFWWQLLTFECSTYESSQPAIAWGLGLGSSAVGGKRHKTRLNTKNINERAKGAQQWPAEGKSTVKNPYPNPNPPPPFPLPRLHLLHSLFFFPFSPMWSLVPGYHSYDLMKHLEGT